MLGENQLLGIVPDLHQGCYSMLMDHTKPSFIVLSNFREKPRTLWSPLCHGPVGSSVSDLSHLHWAGVTESTHGLVGTLPGRTGGCQTRGGMARAGR